MEEEDGISRRNMIQSPGAGHVLRGIVLLEPPLHSLDVYVLLYSTLHRPSTGPFERRSQVDRDSKSREG